MVDLTDSSSPYQQSIPNYAFYVPAVVVFGLAACISSLLLLAYDYYLIAAGMLRTTEALDRIWIAPAIEKEKEQKMNENT